MPRWRLADDPWAADKVGEILHELQPELVYVPFYLEEHADHRAASAVLIDGARGRWERFQCVGYEVWTPLFPNCLVRIDATLPVKKAALAKYETQLADMDYLHASIGLNAHRSAGLLDARGGHAEAVMSRALGLSIALRSLHRAELSAACAWASCRVTSISTTAA